MLILKSGGESMPSPSKTHGPLVKNGPNAGKVRSRNENGQWRKKRSDTGKPRTGTKK